MALTTELIRANAALSGLTDEQIAAITTLSVNDENSVIANKVGEIYGGLDKDILTVSGVPKNGVEKTYDYAKRVLSQFKTDAENKATFENQVKDLTKEKERLEKAIADGATDTETAKALAQAKADLSSVQTEYNSLKQKFDETADNYQKELFGIRVESQINAATSGLKFKPELPETATKILLDQAISKIKGMPSELVDDGKGGKTLVFKDESGAILRNPNNQLNPYTPADLLGKELETMGVLDKGRQAAGGGTVPPAGSATVDGTGKIQVSASTRVEAYDAITNSLTQQGIKLGTPEFDTAMDQAWTDNNISALPEK